MKVEGWGGEGLEYIHIGKGWWKKVLNLSLENLLDTMLKHIRVLNAVISPLIEYQTWKNVEMYAYYSHSKFYSQHFLFIRKFWLNHPLAFGGWFFQNFCKNKIWIAEWEGGGAGVVIESVINYFCPNNVHRIKMVSVVVSKLKFVIWKLKSNGLIISVYLNLRRWKNEKIFPTVVAKSLPLRLSSAVLYQSNWLLVRLLFLARVSAEIINSDFIACSIERNFSEKISLVGP